MAGRPIKEDGINSNMTNKQIADRYQSLIKEKNEHIKSLEDEIKKLNLELKEKSLELRKYETQKIIMLTEKETIKKILMYFAKGKTYKTIYDKMVYVGFDGTIEYIKNICENIETLENDLVLYYNQQLKDYEESVKVNHDLINDILIQVLKQYIND